MAETYVDDAQDRGKSATAASVCPTSLDAGERFGLFKLFPAPASARSGRATDLLAKNKTPSPSSPPLPMAAAFEFPARIENRAAASSDILWSVGRSNKRGTPRKDRRNGKSSLSVSSVGRLRTRVATTRSTAVPCDVTNDNDMRVSDAGANLFAFSMLQTRSSRGSGRANSSTTASKSKKTGDCAAVGACQFKAEAKLSRVKESAFPPTVPSTASVASATASSKSQSFSTVDPLVLRARAVLQDCIRTRKREQSNARKRSIEGCFGGDQSESKWHGWHDDFISKPTEYGVVSPRSSYSSDDELKHISLVDQPLCSEKSDRGCDSKLAQEEMYRQILVGDFDLSSSPEYRCFSPSFEEKGLPVEVRYQLPLALGTANETCKECAICQLYYGIGDHIVTLPCQHFFHACCVDKWLWDHTSCPLCRTEVTLDQMTEAPSMAHKFTECSPLDRETIRRQLRSSSLHTGFRSVVPVEIDECEQAVSRMAIDDGLEAEEEPSGLICPTPHFATHVQDKRQ
ncbi:unnamed protein product [Hyaloperonospora brassicae]|uniref:RING-type domain-containing protein n=1 Tax=Hyaloperonospora brassicae TaxID=162125 RepID=A0AAV0ULE2_HYABA|nr:unnamed protein product [Hyaloperonospora brassicae]